MGIFASLAEPLPTVGQLKASCLAALAAVRSQLKWSWHDMSFPRAIMEWEARQLADLHQTVRGIGLQAAVDQSTGDDLTCLALSNFGLNRMEAQMSERDIILTNTGITARTWPAGALSITSRATPVEYHNVSAVALPAQSNVTVRVQATAARADATSASSLVLGAPVPQVGISATDDWAVLGRDAEHDESLRKRCLARWPSMAGSEDPRTRYQAWARESHPEITRVTVYEDLYASGPAQPDVTVYCASVAGAPSSEASAACSAGIERHRPIGVLVKTLPAVNRTIELGGVIRVLSSQRGIVESVIATRLGEHFASLEIGRDVLHSRVLALVQSIPGVVHAALETRPTPTDPWEPLSSEGKWLLARDEVPVAAKVYRFEAV